MKNWLDKIHPCPICGSKAELNKTPSTVFRKVKQQCGGGLVTVECRDCNVSVTDYGFKAREQGIPYNYNNLLEECISKWNKLGGGNAQ